MDKNEELVATNLSADDVITHKLDINWKKLKDSVESFLLKREQGEPSRYTLKKRLTEKDLRKETANHLRVAEEKFLHCVMESMTVYLDNVHACKKMDEILGTEEESAVPSVVDHLAVGAVEQLKDGSLKHQCPMHRCQSSTFKLRRHLQNQHMDLPVDKLNYAVEMSAVMTRNRQGRKSSVVSRGRSSPVRMSNKSNVLVSRKHNHKKCVICSKLVINLSDHVKNVHKVKCDDAMYSFYVKEPPVIPSCYTKLENGVRVELQDGELAEAKRAHSVDVERQQEDLNLLKITRENIETMKDKIREVEDLGEYRNLKKSLEDEMSKYKRLRFKDKRKYSEQVKLWRDSFSAYLTSRKQNNPERAVRMAMDVILPHKSLSEDISFANLSKPSAIRTILNCFNEKEGISNTSKLKYLRMFGLFVKFLFTDVSSPERTEDMTSVELISMDIKAKHIYYEIDNQCVILSKSCGADLVKTKKKAKSKLLTKQEIEDLISETRTYLMDVLGDMKKNIHRSYSKKQLAKVRNSLILIGTVRLGRRAMEFTTMKVSEAEDAELTDIDGKKYYFIKVVEQKTTKSSGEPATIPYEEEEYKVLATYIKDLRPRIAQNKFCDLVFPSFPNLNTSASNDLSLAGVFKLMQGFPTSSGKKFSSRTLRSSFITINRGKGYMSENDKRDMAKAMNHSLNTAERHYNYQELSNSVVNTLSLTQNTSADIPSTSDITLESIISENFQSQGEEAFKASTPLKRKQPDEEFSSDESVDVTIKELRSKKVKKFHNDENYINTLRALIDSIVKEFQLVGRKDELLTASGLISTKSVSKLIPKEMMERMSTKLLRKLIKESLEDMP